MTSAKTNASAMHTPVLIHQANVGLDCSYKPLVVKFNERIVRIAEEPTEADHEFARLIAAAPALAEALREIVENAPGERRHDWLEQARAALALAGAKS
jgi:hypothetical protein